MNNRKIDEFNQENDLVASKFANVKISDLGEIITGSTPSTKNKEFYGGDIPFIKVSDLKEDTPFVKETEKKLTEKGAEVVSSRELGPNSVMVTCIGSIGKNGVSTGRCFTNQQINSIIPKQEYDTWYIYYKMEQISKKLKNYAGGSAHPILSKTDFSEINIDIHESKKERKKIGDFLSVLDKKISINRDINQIIEKIAQTIFKSWFVDFEPYEEFKDSELGKIPKEFEVNLLGDVISLEYGKGLPKREREGSEYPVFGSSGKIDSHKKPLVNGPGIIVGRKGTIGTVTLSMKDFWPIDTTFYVEPKIEYDIFFYYHLLKNAIEFGYLGSDSAVPGLNRNIALDQEIAFPPEEEVDKFVRLIRPLYHEVENLEKENDKLTASRGTLLPKLMSGEIRVSD